MAAGGVFIYRMLSRHAPTLSLISAMFLVIAGLISITGSATYATAAELADDWVAAAPADKAQLEQLTRVSLIMLQALQMPLILSFALAISGFARIAARNRLVPRWLGIDAAVALALVAVTAGATSVGLDMVTWIVGSLALVLLLVWLVVAGLYLAFMGSPQLPGSEGEARLQASAI
jgi:hypothetical protein